MATHQELIGRNLRRIREERGWSQALVAHHARRYGLRWTQVVVSQIEAGLRDLRLAEWWSLPHVLGVEADELLRPIDAAEVIDVEDASLRARDLRALAAGTPLLRLRYADQLHQATEQARREPEKADIALAYGLDESDVPSLIVDSHGEVERNAAVRLGEKFNGLDAFEITVAAHSLWDAGLSEYRETALAEDPGEGAARAVRGHITRALMRELEDRIGEVRGRRRGGGRKR